MTIEMQKAIEEKVANRIRSWYSISQKENAIPFRFMALWIAFNGLYDYHWSSYTGGNSDKDKEKFHHYAEVAKLDSVHRKLLSEPKYKMTVEFLRDWNRGNGVSDMSPRKLNATYERSPARARIAHTFEVNQVLDCLYQIRCNLFHGGKDASEGSSDEPLIQAAYLVLSHLIESDHFLEVRDNL